MRATVALLAALVAVAGCGGGDGAAEPVELEGVIGEIARANGDVSAFTLRTDDGETHELAIAADVDYGFDLAHLEEHRAQHLPVRCTAERRDGRLVALEISDA